MTKTEIGNVGNGKITIDLPASSNVAILFTAITKE
jgi:hypothetical protein